MNQQRLQSYITLIQQLLACPSGEEWILLRQNEALVTPELVQIMEQVATQLASQRNFKEAKFLHNLAGQIHHLFVAKTVQPTNDDDKSQAYLELIKALLDTPKGSEDELLAANQALIGPGLVHMMQQVAAQLAANDDQETANYLQHWAMELNHRWLQQHDFQPMLKKEAEPKHSNYPPMATQSTPPQIQSPQASPILQSNVSAPTEEDEDVWAEPSEKPVQTKPLPISEPAPTEPTQSEPTQPDPVQDRVSASPPPDTALPDSTIYTQINQYLETIAGALTKLSETLASPVPPAADPLWYMDVLERAYAGNWVLTSTEIQTLIGMQPTCPKGSESFQRGCWVFVKAGKVGSQRGWRVIKTNDHDITSTEE
jgi:hypothetical protein